jgi:hypothetical protein
MSSNSPHFNPGRAKWCTLVRRARAGPVNVTLEPQHFPLGPDRMEFQTFKTLIEDFLDVIPEEFMTRPE